MKLSRVLFPFLFLALGWSCSSDGPARFATVEALMLTLPDSAWACLQADSARFSGAPEGERMKYDLLCLEAKNKLYIPLGGDSLALSVADYYAKEGTAEERMRAYYVLGCTYMDMSLFPLAQQWLHKAAAEESRVAPTPNNWNRLARVYGQLGELYIHKTDVRVAFDVMAKMEGLAAKSGDEYLRHRIWLRKLDCFLDINQQDSILLYANRCMAYFLSRGDEGSAASALLGRCGAYLAKGNYAQAAKDLQCYEDSFGLVDEQRYVRHEEGENHESYYAYKGLYYMAIHRPDSARIYFYRTFCTPKPSHRIGGAYRLARIYELEHRADSAAKYYSIHVREKRYADSLRKAEQLQEQEMSFDREKAYEEVLRAEKEKQSYKRWLACVVWGSLVFGLLAAGLLLYIVRRHKAKYERLCRSYDEVCLTVSELQSLVSQEKAKGAASTMRCLQLEAKLAQSLCLKKELEEANPDLELYKARTSQVSRTPEALAIRECLQNKIQVLPSHLSGLQRAVSRELPEVMDFLYNPSQSLSSQQVIVCCLICASFSPGDMAHILALSPQAISSIRVRLGKKLFPGCRGTRDFDFRLLNVGTSHLRHSR